MNLMNGPDGIGELRRLLVMALRLLQTLIGGLMP